jgi:hypothetical protein
MNTPQKCIVAGGILLLILNFTFPYTTYPVREVREEEGSTKIYYGIRRGFYPIWKGLAEHEKKDLPDYLYAGPVIEWPVVFGFAVGLVVLCGWSVYQLGGSRKPSPGSSPTVEKQGDDAGAANP